MLSAETGWGKVRKRDRARIYCDILNSIIGQEGRDGVAKITRVQNEVNLPSDRVRIHLEELRQLGLIDQLNSTEKGREFVSEYAAYERFLRRFGL